MPITDRHIARAALARFVKNAVTYVTTEELGIPDCKYERIHESPLGIIMQITLPDGERTNLHVRISAGKAF